MTSVALGFACCVPGYCAFRGATTLLLSYFGSLGSMAVASLVAASQDSWTDVVDAA
ncbi:hypothetical protein DFJ66_5159 [Saccharothrix variisporea]|uniref:Uncharacterized protein n=1 Tax=Saccharothrix variisporea TaxID=543527 RepID=A0A495XCY4_9PSEU|nr:hypothetical protein DFJ66_5159 [Saccharothrix variisporea]